MSTASRTLRALALAMCLGVPAYAGGPVADYPDDGPCDVPFPSFEEYAATVVDGDAAQLYALATKIREGLCHDVQTPLEIWRARGWTDETLLAAIFNGHRPEIAPSPVPLPVSVWAMLTAILALAAIKSGTVMVRIRRLCRLS